MYVVVGLINMFLYNYPDEPCSSAQFYSGQVASSQFTLCVVKDHLGIYSTVIANNNNNIETPGVMNSSAHLLNDLGDH